VGCDHLVPDISYTGLGSNNTYLLRFEGMIGASFRVDGKKAETFYVRPENSRLNNQRYRNQSTQHESLPDFPWLRLRDEAAGMYESYVDLEPGA
jgi:hypothetical protein